jgi:hypothetical protein
MMDRLLVSLLATSNGVYAQRGFGPRPGSSLEQSSRGSFAERMRDAASDFQGGLGRMKGPIAVGRCAKRTDGPVCCMGSSWNCQAPGSTCSCDQMCLEFGDCCPDYNETCSFESIRERDMKECVPHRDYEKDIEFEPIMVGGTQGAVGSVSGDPHFHI